MKPVLLLSLLLISGCGDQEEGEGWAVRLNGVDESLQVSRRQLSAVREALAS